VISLLPQLPSHLIAKYGYWAVAGSVGLENIGIPLPGETTLILASIFAGSTHELEIALVIAAAAAGSMIGSTFGFWIGREIGYPVLIRYGHYVRLTESKLKIGQYLFLRHGGKIVFFGRFLPVLRMLTAPLAGANCMGWGPFLLFNAAGSLLWSCFYGLGAYSLGKAASHLHLPLELGLTAALIAVLPGVALLLRRQEASLAQAAEQALPGPLRDRRRSRGGRP
jgi:membrane protein DedA with SNARE-associated domain